MRELIQEKNYFIKKGILTLSEMETFLSNATDKPLTVLAYFTHGVVAGKLQDGRWIFPEPFQFTPHLVEMRLFNPEEEIHVVQKTSDEYIVRHISDEHIEGYETVTYDHEVDYYLVNGTQIQKTETIDGQNFTTLTEESGIVLTLPITIQSKIIQVFVEVIQFITYDIDGMMAFTDARLSRFVERVGKGENVDEYQTLH